MAAFFADDAAGIAARLREIEAERRGVGPLFCGVDVARGPDKTAIVALPVPGVPAAMQGVMDEAGLAEKYFSGVEWTAEERAEMRRRLTNPPPAVMWTRLMSRQEARSEYRPFKALHAAAKGDAVEAPRPRGLLKQAPTVAMGLLPPAASPGGD
jgi:hypothetical protein